MEQHAARIARVRSQIKRERLGGLLVSHLANVRYLCGYNGSAGLLLVTPSRSVFLTDFRYQEQVKREVKGARRVIIRKDLYSDLLQRTDIAKLRRAGFEAQHLTYAQYDVLRRGGAQAVPTVGLVEQLRQVKDAAELRAIARAAAIADRAFARIVREIRPGMTELAIGARLEALMKSFGAARPSFETIVGSGPNGALPHAKPGTRKVRRGDFIVLDFGAYYQGYCSDMTRTVLLGRPTDRHKLVYGVVRDAQQAGLDAVRAGVSGKQADAASRGVIERAGFGQQFGHGLGHGVGLEVHELPRLGKLSDNIVPEHAVVTVEPGVYLPGWGGVRIEDLVAVTKTGNRILSRSPKELIAIK
ncbi:MAG TPA: aminopeptidase P family protein [Candidatus Edwardsbacteria bacterium]|nr:aminopeptidase P family protein [Candidatus Edwardsbacteria bacterium]